MSVSSPPLAVAIALLAWFVSSSARAEQQTSSTVFAGMCDASAAAAIDGTHFVVADDEDNILRIYSRAGGRALSHFDLSPFLGVQGKTKAKEADLEGATHLGMHTFWITSHGRNSKGKDKPERERLFATVVRANDGNLEIVPIGKPYRSLLDDLLAEERLKKFNLEHASQLAPKADGGLNIEGLASTPDGHLLIGFRSPLRERKALLVPILNPLGITNGDRAKLGAPIELDLAGLGIRSLERVGNRYVIIAGDPGETGQPSRLFQWDGKGEPWPIPGVTLKGLNPEGVAFHNPDGVGEYFILSDDGSRSVNGVDCKDLKDPALKSFRGRVLQF